MIRAWPLFLLLLSPLPAAASESVSQFSSLVASRASQRLLLQVADLGDRLIAVGQFGHILISTDRGKNWRQAKRVPTNVTLTAVDFPSPNLGFAVGYDTTILKTENGGETWRRVYHDLEMETAKSRRLGFSNEIGVCGKEPDGCLFPLFGVHFFNEKHGIAVGAFSTILETRDGGNSWQKRKPDYQFSPEVQELFQTGEIFEDDITGGHLNGIVEDGRGHIYLPSEFGIVIKSSDKGGTFEAVKTPYEGSFWGGIDAKPGVILYGMRGNMYRSENGGASWKKIPSGTDQSIHGAVRLINGDIVATGLGGVVARSIDGGRSFKAQNRKTRLGYADISEGQKNEVILFGVAGIEHHRLPNVARGN